LVDAETRLGLIRAAWANHRAKFILGILQGRFEYAARILYFEIEGDASEPDDDALPEHDEVVVFRAIVYRRTIDVVCGKDLIETLRA
jgi:hypothetical protein